MIDWSALDADNVEIEEIEFALKKAVQKRTIAVHHMFKVQDIMKYRMKAGFQGGYKTFKKLIVADIKQIKNCNADIKKLRSFLPIRIYPA